MRGQRQRVNRATASSSGQDAASAPTWNLPQLLLQQWALGKMSPQSLQEVWGLVKGRVGGKAEKVGGLVPRNIVGH